MDSEFDGKSGNSCPETGGGCGQGLLWCRGFVKVI